MKMRKMISRIVCSILTGVLLFSSMGTFSAAEETEDNRDHIIVSLGDSYASGEGIPPFYGQDKINDSFYFKPTDWLAHRSTNSWPGMLSLPSVGVMSEHPSNWFFVAASGAETINMLQSQEKIVHNSFIDEFIHFQATMLGENYKYELAPQLDVFDYLNANGLKADYVTVSIGGNDVHFTDIVTKAALEGSYLSYYGLQKKINSIWDEFNSKTQYQIEGTYKLICRRAGEQATVIVVGYPGLISLKGSHVFFNEWEAAYIDSQVSEFNKRLQAIVEKCREEGFNIYFVSVEEAFFEHEAYSNDPYLNGIIMPAQEYDLDTRKPVSNYSMHPNLKGAKVYAQCVQALIDELESDREVAGLDNQDYLDDGDVWNTIDQSAVLEYIGKTFDQIQAKAGALQSVDAELDAWLLFLYSFADISGIEFSFETYLPNAEEQMDQYGRIPANYALQYISGSDRCDGLLVHSLSVFGLHDDLMAQDIGAEVFEFMPDIGIWAAHAEHGGCDFYFICEDSNGWISDRCACWVVGELPAQVQEQQKNGWENKGRSTDTWEEGDWYYYVSGQPATGWKTIDGKTYYFHNDGKMAESLTTINGATYFFQEHFYGAGPSTGDKPDHGTLSKGGFEQRSIGDMVYCDTNGSVITYDGEGSGTYFAYATNAFDLVWNYDHLSYYSDIADYGYFDIDRDGYKEFYIKRGSGEANYKYEFYTPDFQDARYKKIGTIDAAYCNLSMENSHLYLVNRQTGAKREIRIVNGNIEIESSGSSQPSPSTSKTSLVEKLLSSSYAKEIGMTFGELKTKYGPLDYVYLATEEPIQVVFKNSKGSVSYFFEGVADSISDELWDESVANNGIISPSSAGKLILDSDICTGVYTSFRILGVDNLNDYETWFTADHLYYDELWDERYYVTEHDRFELSTKAYAISTTSDFHVDVDDWVEITLKRSFWSSHESSSQPETPIPSSKWHYDPYAARDAAENVLNTIDGKGATYVSKLLREGGLTKVKQSGAGDLIDYLKNTKNWDGESIGKVVLDPSYSELHVGDILCSVCSKGSSVSDYTNGHGKGKDLYYGIQVFFVSEVGPDYIRVYSKNNDRHNEILRLSCNGGDFIDNCGKCGNSKNVHWIVFVFDEAIKR